MIAFIRVYGVQTSYFHTFFIKIGIISVSLTYFGGITSVGLRQFRFNDFQANKRRNNLILVGKQVI